MEMQTFFISANTSKLYSPPSRPVPEAFYAAKWLAQVTHVLGVDEHHASFNATRQGVTLC